MIAISFQSAAEIATARAANAVLEGVALAALSWFALRWIDGRNSGRSPMTRFAVWFSTLLAVALLPVLNWRSTSSLYIGAHSPELTLSSLWATWLFSAWAVISGALLIRLGFSLAHVRKLRRQCRQIDGSQLAFAELAQQCGGRKVEFLQSDSVRVPAAIGFFKPAVVLPAWTLRELSGDELRAIVLHEIAHLRRWDDWTNLAQKFLKAVFFFHPAVWWIDARLALEREMACDDMVLEQTANAHRYAQSLVSVAEKAVAERTRMAKALALAQGALGRAHEVSRRVAQILDGRPRVNRGWRPAMGMIGALTAVAVMGMPFSPELVSFQGKKPQTRHEPTLSASSNDIDPMVIPARWTEKQMSTSMLAHSSRRATSKVENRTDPEGRTYTAASRTANRARNYVGSNDAHTQVIPAKASVHKLTPKPKVMMANADTRTKQPAQTLLVMRSSQTNSEGMPVWTLSVWRFTSADGQTVQEMIVMNSI
jgi:beta-lactamase regulating signal transducer with metallopeptidase domain